MASTNAPVSPPLPLPQLRYSIRRLIFSPPPPPSLKSLDSSIKRCTAFIKKVKVASLGEQRSAILSDLTAVNVFRYQVELINSILDCRLQRSADCAVALEILALVHWRHEEFLPDFMEALMKTFGNLKERRKLLTSGGSGGISLIPPPPAADLLKRRWCLRLLAELFLSGLLKDVKPLMSTLWDLMAWEKAILNTPDSNLADSAGLQGILIAFTKSFTEALTAGESPDEAQFPLPPEARSSVLPLLNQYFTFQSTRLVSIHQELSTLQRKNARSLMIRGEINNEQATKTAKLEEMREKLRAAVESLSVLLSQPMPALPEPEPEDVSLVKLNLPVDASILQAGNENSTFDDEEERQFYEDLRDLRLVVPPILLEEGKEKEKAKAIRAIKEEQKAQQEAEESADPSASTALVVDSSRLDDSRLESWSIDDLERAVKEIEATGVNRFKKRDKNEAELVEPEEITDADLEEMAPPASLLDQARVSGAPFDRLIVSLSECANRDSTDKLAEEFCYCHTKANRELLVSALFQLPRFRSDLVPHLSRFTATISKYFSAIGEKLVQLLQRQFYRLLKRRDQPLSHSRLEQRTNNIRFLCELTKFRICEPVVLFRCWKAAMLNGSFAAIQTVCALLEHAGRFLYKAQITHIRTVNLIEQLKQLRDARLHDKALQFSIANAISAALPAPPLASTRPPAPTLSPIERYVRFLLFQHLNSKTIEFTVSKLKRLDWGDVGQREFAISCLAAPCSVAFSNLNALACVTAALDKQYGIGPIVVDTVLEEIRAGLDIQHPALAQSRISHIRYIAALFAFKLIEAQLVFDTAYSLLLNLPADSDGTEFSFRLRLLATLLDVVGHYFDRGIIARRLERFMLYLQLILASIRCLPSDLDQQYRELYRRFCPKMKLSRETEEIRRRIQQFEKDRGNRGILKKDFIKEIQGNSALQAGVAVGPAAQPSPTAGQAESKDEKEKEADLYGDDDEAEDGEDDEEADDGEPRSADSGDEDAEEAEENSGSESDSEEDPASDHEDVAYRRGPAAAGDSDDFQRDLDRLIAESVEGRRYEARSGNSSIASAKTILANEEKFNKEKEKEKIKQPKIPGVVPFMLLTKRKAGASVQTRTVELLVPASAKLAIENEAQKAQEKDEQEKMKRLVLKSIQREERSVDWDETAERLNTAAQVADRRENARGQWNRGKPLKLGQLYDE